MIIPKTHYIFPPFAPFLNPKCCHLKFGTQLNWARHDPFCICCAPLYTLWIYSKLLRC